MNPLEVENSNGFGVTMKYLNRRHTCKTDTGYEDTTVHSPAVSFLAGWLRGGRGFHNFHSGVLEDSSHFARVPATAPRRARSLSAPARTGDRKSTRLNSSH